MSLRIVLLLFTLALSTVGCCHPRMYHGSCCSPAGVGPRIKNGISCQKGCGEVYWGDWISDPPDCCEPCDSCGNFTGAECGKRGFYGCYRPCWRNLFRLHSSRCDDGCCGGCSSCGEVGEFVGESIVQDGTLMHHEPAPQRVLHDPKWDQAAPAPAPGVPTRTGRQPKTNKTTMVPQRRNVQPVIYEEELEELEETEHTNASTPTGRRNYAR